MGKRKLGTTSLLYWIIFIVGLVAGAMFCCSVSHSSFSNYIETFTPEPLSNEDKQTEDIHDENTELSSHKHYSDSNCYDLLIKKENKIYLYNSTAAYVPGVNPIVFNNLNDYTQYMEWEKANGVKCPILTLEHTIDAQNNSKFNLMPKKISDPNEIATFNGFNSSPAGKDIGAKPQNKRVKKFNALANYYLSHSDTEYKNTTLGGKQTANAMDTNWGGTEFSRKMVDDGHYTKHSVDERFNNKNMDHMM